MLPSEIARVLDVQAGVISRRQVLAAAWTKSDVDRMLRRREWVRLLPRVFLDHTGSPTWLQRAWGGVLYYWPAALTGISALRATAGPGWRGHEDSGAVWVAVAAERHVSSRPGYRVRCLKAFDRQVHPHTHPPRMRFEEACLDAALAEADPLKQVQLLAQGVQSRRTTPARPPHRAHRPRHGAARLGSGLRSPVLHRRRDRAPPPAKGMARGCPRVWTRLPHLLK